MAQSLPHTQINLGMEKAVDSKHTITELAHCVLPVIQKSTSATLSKTERVERWEEAHRKTIALLFESGFLYTKF
jgi:uncharacterized membrane protein